MKGLAGFLAVAGTLALVGALQGAEPGSEVVVIYNTGVPGSKGIANYYAAKRGVPAKQVFGFDLPTNESMSRTDYRQKLESPLLQKLKDQKLFTFGPQDLPDGKGAVRRVERTVIAAKIRYAVLVYGVPLKISRDWLLREEGTEDVQKELQRNEAAVDSELACLPLVEEKYPLTGVVRNPLFACTNRALLNPTNGILLTARLDGPTAPIALGLVDKALEGEASGLWGRAYFDVRGLTNGAYKLGDDWILGASRIARAFGYETIVDEQPDTFPASFPMSQIGIYVGWYTENVSGPFAQPSVEFMPGAFAYHLHSYSATSLRTAGHNWVGPLLAKGATATMGCVEEPFLALTPEMTVFISRFTAGGFTFGEAAYAAQNVLSWQTTVVGDPLYRPFGKSAQQLHAELEQSGNRLIEWSYLRLVNLQLLEHRPLAQVGESLEGLPLTARSAVLKEKLAGIYEAEGKPSSAAHALQEALELETTPQQRIRLTLALADRLAALDRTPEAETLYRDFVKRFPEYPDLAGIYRRLLAFAEKSGRKEDAAHFRDEMDRLNALRRER